MTERGMDSRLRGNDIKGSGNDIKRSGNDREEGGNDIKVGGNTNEMSPYLFYSSKFNSVSSFLNISKTTASGTLSQNSAPLIFQSRFFTWSDKTTPVIFNPDGIMTSKGYPFI